MTRQIPDLFLGLALIVWAGIGATSSSCSHQAILSAQADVLVRTQQVRHRYYDSLSETCLDSAETFEAWRECMAPAYGLARAADTYDGALRLAQVALRAGDDWSPSDLQEAACALLRALDAAGLDLPDDVASVASAIGGC